MEDFLLYLQGLQLFLATFLVHWQTREFLFNFCIFTESEAFFCYRDFLTTWWVLLCVAFQLCVQAARIPVHSYNCPQLCESSDNLSATSANCSGLRGAVIRSTQLLQLNVKAASKPEAITPESSS